MLVCKQGTERVFHLSDSKGTVVVPELRSNIAASGDTTISHQEATSIHPRHGEEGRL